MNNKNTNEVDQMLSKISEEIDSITYEMSKDQERVVKFIKAALDTYFESNKTI